MPTDTCWIYHCEERRAERANLNKRLDRCASEYYVIRGALHIAGRFEKKVTKGGGQETYFNILATATSPEGLCVELDHAEALEEQKKVLWREREINRALEALRSLSGESAEQVKLIDAALNKKPSLWRRLLKWLKNRG